MTCVVFLAGIHGVGKGHFAEYLCTEIKADVYSASALIKKEKKRRVDVSKFALDPDENQDSLVAAFSRMKLTSNVVVLDGHFVLLMTDGYFQIPLNTYREIGINLIIVKSLDVDTIYQRLISRDGASPEKAVLEEMQEQEKARALSVAKALSIPVVFMNSDDYPSIKNKILTYLI
ncbi:ATP-binding protein [Zhongshania sp.]|jgi:adenylate kinase|uniref:ATP-binding protein n=1 Tax=Zhongshania sp. TaxID=1971902 RepID=UPI001B47EAB0|nr:ATP-binding protein [Zhongshania sp.]MBQ0795091.1 AAA family ATPase [Zhongshania sp.]